MTAPTKIGKYEIRHQIGRGAMGTVYEAFDPVIERRVAVKTLRLELFEPSQIADVRARFKREAQSAGQLTHPHIVTVYEYGEQDGTPYIVMEFLAGNELSKILSRGSRLPLSEVVRLMTQLLGALSYAHEHKVVHRDVKPGNIFILDDGSLKVVDFGLAHVEASNLTDTGALLGTPAYMSPEQFLALPVDERSDIFSAGVILYELLTGDKPFTGSVTTIMQKVLRQDPIEVSVLNPMISTAWDTVIKRAMAKKPEARFQSARQFSETIKQVFDKGEVNVSVEVTLTGGKAADLGGETLRPSPGKQQAVPPVTAASDIAPARRSYKKGWAIAAVAGVVAIGAATIYLIQRPRDELAKPGPATVTAQTEIAAPKAAAPRAAAESGADIKAKMDDKAAADKAAADKVAADKVVAEKAEQVAKVAQERAAQEKAAEAKVAAEKAQAQMIAAQKAKKEQGARAQSSVAEMQSAMLGDWVLTFQNPGSGRGRLKITNVSENPDGSFQIFGTYAYGDNQMFALKSGEITKSGSASQLKLTTALGSLFVAESQGEGSFRGESYPAKGPKDPFKMEKARAEKAEAERLPAERAAAEKAAAEKGISGETAAATFPERPSRAGEFSAWMTRDQWKQLFDRMVILRQYPEVVEARVTANNKLEIRASFSPYLPNPFAFYCYTAMSVERFNQRDQVYRQEGYTLVHRQSVNLNGTELVQAIWVRH